MNRDDLLNKYGKRCAYCGDPITEKTMQVDHIRSKRRGGTDAQENLNPSCRPCNNRKSIMTLNEFRAEIAAQPARLHRDSGAFRLAERFGAITVNEGHEVTFYEANEFADEISGFEAIADLLGRVVMLACPIRSPLTGDLYHALGEVSVDAKAGSVALTSAVKRRVFDSAQGGQNEGASESI